MKKQLRLLGGFGLLSLLVMGASVSSSYADGACNPKSPMRGIFALSQVGYTVPGVTGVVTLAGISEVDECGNTTGRAVFNGPGFSGFAIEWTGTCTLRPSGNEVDCNLNPNEQGVGSGRYCVLTGKGGEGCFDTWHCINSSEVDAGMVLMADLERVQAGTCK